jgi:Mor family transcriptional regulator
MDGKINTKNLKRIADLNGMTVVELARAIRRHRVQVYRALRNPRHNRPTYELIHGALPHRRLS